MMFYEIIFMVGVAAFLVAPIFIIDIIENR